MVENAVCHPAQDATGRSMREVVEEAAPTWA